jgi:hypothetical protein
MRRLNPLGAVPVEMWTTRPRCPQSHSQNKSRRSGHVMCYQTGQLNSLSRRKPAVRDDGPENNRGQGRVPDGKGRRRHPAAHRGTAPAAGYVTADSTHDWRGLTGRGRQDRGRRRRWWRRRQGEAVRLAPSSYAGLAHLAEHVGGRMRSSSPSRRWSSTGHSILKISNTVSTKWRVKPLGPRLETVSSNDTRSLVLNAPRYRSASHNHNFKSLKR